MMPPPTASPMGLVPNQPYSHANHNPAGGSHFSSSPTHATATPNFPPLGGQASSAGKKLEQRTTTLPSSVAEIEDAASQLMNQEWAVSRLAEAIACVNNPALAKDKGIVVTVVLAGTTKEVSVAPAEVGMSAQDLAPYKAAASKALLAMQQKYQNSQQTTSQTMNQLKARYSEATKSISGPKLEWEKFLQGVRESNKRLFRCQLEDGTVITIGESKAIDDALNHKVKLSSK